MSFILLPRIMELPPGAVLRFPCTWDDYEQLAAERGDKSIPRLKYRSNEVLVMVPLPEHGKSSDVISDIVKVLLDHQHQAYDSYTPITMKLPETGGIEPDHCFYITNWPAVRGKKRIDWQTDPPPDLVIEVDVTSFSAVEDYLPYRVPEVWMLKADQLQINRLTGSAMNSAYVPSAESLYFSGTNLSSIVTECLQIAYAENTSAAIRQLKNQLKNQV